MRTFYSRIILLFFGLSVINGAIAQQTAHPNTRITDEINGYYVALPDDYNDPSNSSTKYPLLIVIPGRSQMGDGSAAQLPNLGNSWGTPPWRLNQPAAPDAFPSSFTVNTPQEGNKTFKFIVFTPQFKFPSGYADPYILDSANGFPGTDISAVIDYCKENYRVDHYRVYLTGFSLGGAQVWSYLFSSVENAKKIAGAVIVSGGSEPSIPRGAVIAKGNVPVLAVTGDVDETVPPEWTINWVDSINNSVPPPDTLAKLKVWPGSTSHAFASGRTYYPRGQSIMYGLDMYQWLLLHDNTILLPVSALDFNVISKKSALEINWKTESELNNKGFYLEVSSNGIDFKSLDFVASKGNSNSGFTYSYSYQHPIQGKNYFRLKQVNKDNSFVYSIIKVADYRIPRSINIFPNPVKDVLTLKGSFQFANAHLEIKDMNGKTVKIQNFSGDNAAISVNELSKGVYQGTIAQEKEVYSFTFVKQ